MSCPSCGIEQPGSGKFCVACGAPADQTAPGPVAGRPSPRPDTPSGPHTDPGRRVFVRVVPQAVPAASGEPSAGAGEQLQSFWTHARQVAARFGATTRDTEDGGMLMAFPCRNEDLEASVLHAIAAAQAVRAATETPAGGHSCQEPGPVAARIAIHFGRFLATGPSNVPAVLTDIENEGVELIRLCPPGAICMSAPVQQVVQGRYLARPLGLIGRGDAPRTGAYSLGEPRPSLAGGHDASPDPVLLVGRDRERARIEQTWAEVRVGQGSRMLSLFAPAALGRTRLLEAFLASIDTSDATYVVTSCEEQATLAPYYPLIDIITQLIGATRDDDDDTVALRLMLKTRDAVAAAEGWEATRQHEPDIIELSTVIGELLGIDVASRERYLEPTVLDPECLRQRTFYCLMKFLHGTSCRTPLVLSVENVHLADSATLDALEYLGRMLRGGGRLLLICSGLSSFLELHPDWGDGWAHHETIRLDRIDADHVEHLVRSMLEDGASDDLVQSIVRQARGRPGIAALVAEAWMEQAAQDQVALDIEGDDDVPTIISEPAGAAADSRGATSGNGEPAAAEVAPRLVVSAAHEQGESLEDVTDSLTTGSEFEANPTPPGASGHQRATTHEAPRADDEAGRGPAGVPDVPGSDTAPPPDDGRVDYFFENEAGAGDGLEEGATFIMAYRDDDASPGDEDESASETSLDDLFTEAPEPLGALQHLLPGEIWALRLDRLAADARRVLTVAAISGRTFRGEQLVAQWRLDGGTEDTLTPVLLELRRRGLLERRLEARPWHVSWRFRSTLLQQVVYDSTPLVERHRLHRQLARLLEGDEVGARIRGTYALVGHHYDRGGEADRAFRYYVMAGKKARRTLALREVERLFVRARTLMKETGLPDGGTETIAIHHLLGEVLALLNEPKRAVAELEMALEFARVRGDPKLECEVLMSLCDVLDRRDDRRRALDVARQARRLARNTSSDRLVVQSLRRLGWEHVRAGRIDEGRKAFEEAVQTALAAGNPEMAVAALDALGAFYYVTGNYGLAIRGYGDLLSVIKESVRHRAPGSAFPS